MKISRRLSIGYLSAAFLVAAIGLVGLFGILEISGRFNDIIKSTSKGIPIIEKISAQFFKMQLESTAAISVLGHPKIGAEEAGHLHETINKFNQSDSLAKQLIAHYRSCTPRSNRPVADSLELVRLQHERIFHEIVYNPKGADGKNFLAMFSALESAEEKHYEKIADALNDETDFAISESNEANAVVLRSKWLIEGICLFAVAFALFLGHFLAQNISRRIIALKTATQRLGKGDYYSKVNIDQKDEVGELAAAFNTMVDELEHAKIIEAQKLQLEKLNTELKNKNAALDGFVYRVSHDLKAPIVNISSLIGLMQTRWPAPDIRLAQTMMHISDSTVKLRQTITDLLELSRLEREDKKVYETVDLYAVLAVVTTTIKVEGTTIEADFSRAPTIVFPKLDMESILSNLVGNSIKYACPGVPPHIHIRSMPTKTGVCLAISDNGLGIDLAQNGDKLFGMFMRFHDHVEGSGIGLYIVHKLVYDSGGHIEVESSVGKGTTFRLFFGKKEPSTVLLPVEGFPKKRMERA